MPGTLGAEQVGNALLSRLESNGRMGEHGEGASRPVTLDAPAAVDDAGLAQREWIASETLARMRVDYDRLMEGLEEASGINAALQEEIRRLKTEISCWSNTETVAEESAGTRSTDDRALDDDELRLTGNVRDLAYSSRRLILRGSSERNVTV
ncbi:hypothetical protein FVE85_1855 [Porphyridium purpureum]|uniref:Uncharacterized protein n=1 Tax=Porphyridium purpureum TaxID=35688 RepID=A0A5J4YXJ8_PORPP|nr:hypothetical protein FVE85_1855 [Porphyridium purpureum]|eukprot:POR5079..scf209_3